MVLCQSQQVGNEERISGASVPKIELTASRNCMKHPGCAAQVDRDEMFQTMSGRKG